MANGSGRRVTSGLRAVAAAALVDQGRLPMGEAAVWADALALLVEDGQDDGPVVLLSRIVDRVTGPNHLQPLASRCANPSRSGSGSELGLDWARWKGSGGYHVDSGAAHQLYKDYAASVAYIAVELPSGDQSIGSGRRLLMNRLALMTDGDWRDGGFRQRRPSVETLAWVAASMGRGSRIVGYRRLTGGVCSAVNRLTVERRGMRTFVVLRQYPGGLGLQGSLEKEIANLGVVAGSGLPVPSILATDVAGASTGGAPSLLMTRLQGHVHLNPAEPRSWMTRIAEIAVLLHSLDLPAKMFRPWTDSWIAPLDGFQVPVDAQKPAVWKAAFGVMAAPPPKDTAVFLHCDLLPVNMLWSRGRITGLTDWNSIHRGARAIDVGHCRRYLAALYSPEWSEQLRSLYESIAGVTLDPWWDLYALLHYDDSGPKWIRSQVAGRRPVDVPGMTSRVEVAIETALRRLG